MTKFKGTQGKWTIQQSFDKKYDQPILEINSLFSDNFCTIWTGKNKGEIIHEEAKANALLISKAPEMFEILKIICPILDRYNELEQLEKVQKLIKEATEL